jgi:hypothetical protein
VNISSRNFVVERPSVGKNMDNQDRTAREGQLRRTARKGQPGKTGEPGKTGQPGQNSSDRTARIDQSGYLHYW